MSTLVVDIDKEVQRYVSIEEKKVNIYDLFNTFWVDLHFLLKEKKYNNNFMNSLEKWDYIISDSF